MRSIFFLPLILAAILYSPLSAQELPSLDNPVDEPTLGSVDYSVLEKRVDELTKVVNKHTDQIEEIALRVGKIEKEFSLAGNSPVRSRLATELQQPKEITNLLGKPIQISKSGSKGSTGSRLIRQPSSIAGWATDRVLSVTYGPERIVSVGPPTVISPPLPATPFVASPLAASPVYAAPPRVNQRIVAKPMIERTVTQTNYQPAPQGTPLPRTRRRGILGLGFSNRLGGSCPGGICPTR